MKQKTNSYLKKLFTGIHDEEPLDACKVKSNSNIEIKIILENARKIEKEFFYSLHQIFEPL